MIYLAMALYAEARPFIRALSLKSQETGCRFQLFASDTHALILTGAGSLSAAIADTWLLSRSSLASGRQETAAATATAALPATDCFAQIGCAGYLPALQTPCVSQALSVSQAPSVSQMPPASQMPCVSQISSVSQALPEQDGRSAAPAPGSLYLCHKLTDAQTGHSAYPDMLYRSAFAEASLITYPAVQAEASCLQAKQPPSSSDLAQGAFLPAPVLADMEGYGGYQAASVFLPSHRIFTWKVLSDYGNTEALTAETISGLLTPHADTILSWLDFVSSPSAGIRTTAAEPPSFSTFWKLAETFGYSASQRQRLRQLLRYAALTGHSETDLLTGLSDAIQIQPSKPPVFSFHPAQRKQEGKRILYELEQRLLS